jgi:hypothetical protein
MILWTNLKESRNLFDSDSSTDSQVTKRSFSVIFSFSLLRLIRPWIQTSQFQVQCHLSINSKQFSLETPQSALRFVNQKRQNRMKLSALPHRGCTKSLIELCTTQINACGKLVPPTELRTKPSRNTKLNVSLAHLPSFEIRHRIRVNRKMILQFLEILDLVSDHFRIDSVQVTRNAMQCRVHTEG